MDLEKGPNITSPLAREMEPKTLAIYVFILTISVTLNGVVLAIIRQQRELQEYMRILYKTLATLDMLLGIVWCSWSIVWFFFKSLENCTGASQVFPFLQRSLILSVMACLCGISFNLYLLIARPLRYHNILTNTKFYVTVVSTLVVIILICVVYLPIPHPLFLEFTNNVINRCLTRDHEVSIQTSLPSSVDALLIIVPICLALVFTLAIYGKLLVIVYKKRRVNANLNIQNHAKAIKVEPQEGREVNKDWPASRSPSMSGAENNGQMVQQNNKGFYKRFKGIITVLLLYGSFCLVWIPYIIHFSLQETARWVQVFLDVVALSSTWIQPMVYLMTNEEARKLCWKGLKRRREKR